MDEAVAIMETSAATYLCEFPENWHEIVLELDFLHWQWVADCDESWRAQTKRYLDWVIQRYPEHDADHVHSHENRALALRLTELLPNEGMRQHYRACFALRRQMDSTLIKLLNVVHMLVVM